MEIKLQKWGNSDGIRIPSNILKSLKLKTNDKLKLEVVDDKIILTACKDKKINLKKLFEEYSGDNLAKTFEWDEPRGREIW